MDTPLPIYSHKMETEFRLIVEQTTREGGKFRTMDDYTDLGRLVSDAADYESGEFPGRWVGAVEYTYLDGLLQSAVPVTDLSGRVHAELRSRPEWIRRQASAERWSGRAA